MTRFRRALAVFLVWATAASGEVSEKYAPIYFDTDYPGVFAIAGQIGPNTALKFEEAIAAFGPPQVLSLASPGGIVSEALLIARRVRALGVDTHIQTEEACLSACSLILFGGMVRNAQGDLGVHQLSVATNDPGAIQDSASYIVAALADFDVPSDLLVAMLRTPSDEMYIVPTREKIRYGLMQTAEPARRPEPVPSTVTSPEQRAVAFLADYYRNWSLPNAQAIPAVNRLFAEWVDFYGEIRSFDEIWSERADFTRIWPERLYQLLGDTVSASCAPPVCYVHGQYQWDVRNREDGSHRSGLASVTMTLRETAAGFVIVAESGEVLRRD
ncbi:MAG: hypothetical protein KDK28_18145 [Maritimibacter sp.]|nr:hypothetical protein [Maritimibacter sp.]